MLKIIAEGPDGKYTLPQLLQIMKALRSPEGCPWDKEQTHQSIKNDALEEVYEVVDAIDNNDAVALCEELGDMLLQVVFHSSIAEEENEFTFDEVVDGVSKKLVLRHPHVFGETSVENSSEVLDLWDSIKKQEKSQKTATDTLRSVSCAMPSLVRAKKVQGKAAKVGFDWPDVWGAMDKLAEELTEVSDAVNGEGNIEEELGDLLFACINVARMNGLSPDNALERTNQKFIRRFNHLEKRAEEKGVSLHDMTLSEMDSYWNEAKELER